MNIYLRYYRKLLKGRQAFPRGLETVSTRNVTLSTTPYVFWRRQGDNPMIGIMEGLQLIAGVFDHDAIARIAPHARLDLFTGMSAYGPRCGEQLDWVVDLINGDKYTRQAVIVLTDPREPLGVRPCTTSFQYQVEDDCLNATITMRSSDAVWGMPYDILQFNFLSHVVAACTGFPLRNISIQIGNAHIYTLSQLEKPAFYSCAFSMELPMYSVSEWRKWAVDLIPTITWSLASDMFFIRPVPKESTWVKE